MEPCCGPSGSSRPTSLEVRPAKEIYCRPSSGPCLFCQNLIPIDAEILNAERKLASLLQKREELKWRLGSLCNMSIIHRLPTEIASHIFEIYVKDLRECDRSKANCSGPLLLGAVCRTCRQLAWKLAPLWTTLKFDLARNNLPNRLQVTVEWLDRARSLPLSIELRQESFSKILSPESYRSMLDTILDGYGHRCGSLSLYLPAYLLASINYLKNTESSILDILDVHCTDGNSDFGPTLGLGPHVSPATFKINDVCLRNITVDYRNLTSLTGKSMSFDELLDILKAAPLLKTCTQELVFYEFDIPLPTNKPPIVHFSLEDFSIKLSPYSRTLEIALFFQNLTIPQLKFFTYVDNVNILPVEALIALFGRSSCSLRAVSLHGKTIRGEDLVDIFKGVPSITNLHISSTKHDCPFIRALGVPPRQREPSPSDEPLLPLLQRISIEAGPTFPWNLLPRLFVPFSDAADAQVRPLTEVEICCSPLVTDDELSDSEDDFHDDREIPFISQDVLGQLLLLSKVDFKLQYKRQYDSPAEDLIEVSNDYHNTIVRLREFNTSCLNDNKI